MSITGQIDLMRSRGMVVNAGLAEQWLSSVSYYRLSAYWYPARIFDAAGERTDNFLEGTSFEDVAALYEADRKLRSLVLDGMERIEVALRTRVGEQLCGNDPIAYTDPSRFRPTFDHAKWQLTAQGRVSRATHHNESIKHYRDAYGAFPFWVLAEVLDFGDVSRLYEGLPASDQRVIAESFGIEVDLALLSRNQRLKAQKYSPLVRWMEQFTIIRNTCAHHGRLWNKSFAPAPTTALYTIALFDLLPTGQSERLFGALHVMAQLLQSTSPGTTWQSKVVHLIETSFLPNPLVHRSGLGLPDDWPHRL